MELKAITKDTLMRNKKIVIVKLSYNNFLTFLVTDTQNPQVPGFPACSLSYFKTHKEAQLAIESLYKKVNYRPKFNEDLLGSYSS